MNLYVTDQAHEEARFSQFAPVNPGPNPWGHPPLYTNHKDSYPSLLATLVAVYSSLQSSTG